MKGGVAVALELVRDLATEAPAVRRGAAPLRPRGAAAEREPAARAVRRVAAVQETALAILLEPTDGEIHAGCLGHLTRAAHVPGRERALGAAVGRRQRDRARGRRARSRALRHEPREAVVGGLTFREVLSVTRFEAGIADNVVPDRATATISFRYAPDRTPADAAAYVRALFADVAEVELTGNSPPGAVASGNPLVPALLDSGARGLAPKQAWTNVADFTARGIDAVNFGPGRTAQAHRRDEHVEVAALVHAYETLRRFLAGPIREDGR